MAYEISSELGIEENYIIRTFDFLIDQKILKEAEKERFYPIKITKKDEVLSILNKHPNGLHAKEIFDLVNSSPSKVKIKTYRVFDFNNAFGPNEVMLCARGSIKHTKYGNHDLIDKKSILLEIKEILKNNENVSTLDLVFETLKSKLSAKVDIYDFRHFIKSYGEEYGIFFSGKSQGRSISLGKPIHLNRSDEIIKLFKNYEGFKSMEEISEDLNMPFGVATNQINELIPNAKLCRYAANTYSTNEYAYRNFNDEEIKVDLEKIIKTNLYITNDYLTEVLNKKYYESKSNYFYTSYFFYLKNKFHLKINYHQDILSLKEIPKAKFGQIIDNFIEESEPMEYNYELLSKNVSISLNRFKRFFYQKYIYGAL